jgi:hypothetical protein
MKTPSRIPHPAGFSGLILPLAAILAIAPSLSAATLDPAATEPKTHTLFMGADFDVQLKRSFYRVRDVSGGSVVIRVNDEEVRLPMNEGPVNMKVVQSLKLTKTSAVIVDLKGDRAYTPATNPVRKFLREQPGGAAHLRANQAQIQSYTAQQGVAGARNSGAPAAVSASIVAQAEQQAATAGNNFSSALAAEGSDANSIGTYSAKMEEELAKQLFDAVAVTFEVSSPQPLDHPYVVIVAQYRERDEKLGAAHNWIYARALEPIDPKPRKIRLLQGGLPPGFELLKFKLHLYDRGREIATNVAENRVPLTREEAFQYLKIEYITGHKDTTLPPTAAMGRLPSDLPSRLTGEQIARTLFVKVSKDGLPGEVFFDESCSQKVDDPDIMSVIRDFRFRPALDQGRAVDGIARLNLDHPSF